MPAKNLTNAIFTSGGRCDMQRAAQMMNDLKQRNFMLKSRKAIGWLSSIAIGSVALALSGCNQGNNATSNGATNTGTASSTPAVTKPRVTMGIQMSPAMALVMVAKDKGCFDEAGVNVELKGFTAGKFALQAFLGGSLDFAVAGEVPATLATLQENKLMIPAQVVERTVNEVRVVARREGNLKDPGTYFRAKKRKLGTSFGGGPEFFTYNFLKKYKIGKDQVTVLSQKPGDMPAALVTGSVDAIAIFDPFAFIAEQKMGPKGITFNEPDIYSQLYVLVCRPEDITAKRATIDAVLKGLVKAEQIIKQDPEGSKQIVIKYTKLDKAVVNGIWKNFVFAPALNKNLLNLMTAETAWAKEKGTVPKTSVMPDFRRAVINDAPLKAISPKSVQLP
jgi:NitT/TauT family transport system substrate-binding protein